MLQLRAPRIAYLPLLIQDIRRLLLELVLDDHALATLKEDQLWFDYDGEPLKWSVRGSPLAVRSEVPPQALANWSHQRLYHFLSVSLCHRATPLIFPLTKRHQQIPHIVSTTHTNHAPSLKSTRR